MADIIRKQLCKGVYFTVIGDSRFKNNLLSVNFMLPLSRDTAAVNALLPLVLKRGCREYPDMTVLNARLKELYGARLDGGVDKRGEIQIVSLYCEFLSNRYALLGEDIFAECASLLKSVIFTPATGDGSFRAKDVEVERRNLVDMIDARLNDKRQYANRRMKEEMCWDEAYGADELGTHEQAGAITPEALYKAWNGMIESARTEILFVGDGDSDACEKLFADAFGAVRREEAAALGTKIIRHAGPVKNVKDVLPVSQAKLVMGFRTGSAVPDEDVAAMQLACTIYGGSPHSKLFMNVREKMSLCYYCSSRFERLKGLLVVDSGIEPDNFEKARDEILRQLEAVKNGDFSDDDIRNAVLSIRNSYMELSDSLGDLNSWYVTEALSGSLRRPSDAAEEISSVGREEIVGAAGKISLDTVYLLSGKKKEAVSDEV